MSSSPSGAGGTTAPLQKKYREFNGKKRFYTDSKGRKRPITSVNVPLEPQAKTTVMKLAKKYYVKDGLNIFEQTRASPQEIRILHLLGEHPGLAEQQILDETGLNQFEFQEAVENLTKKGKLGTRL